MDLVFNDICVTIGNKNILTNVSGVAREGSMMAVMGPSGSGKTTLFNCLAGRNEATSGEILIGNKVLTKSLRRHISYVLQHDIFFPNLTLRDTLWYTAMLRIPDSTPMKEKLDRIDELVKDLNLEDCLDTVIGNEMVRGLSGGERKRANIACEMLTKPAILLLDEPTSGLDSTTAFNMMRTCKRFAVNRSVTVLATIHQPSSQLFYSFDNLLLISEGLMAFEGPVTNVVDFFKTVGFECTLHYNPADYILDTIKQNPVCLEKLNKAVNEQRRITNERLGLVAKLYSTSETENEKMIIHNDKHASPFEKLGKDEKFAPRFDEVEMSSSRKDKERTPKWPTCWWTQFRVLTGRNMREARHRIFSSTTALQTVLLCFMTSVLFWQIPNTESGLHEKMSAIFFIVTFWTFNPAFDPVSSYSSEKVIINKERLSGAYRLSAYFFAKMVSETPLLVVQPILFVTAVYWSAGFHGAWQFFATIITIVFSVVSAQSIGLFCSIAMNSFESALTAVVVSTITAMILGGFYIKRIAPWLKWVVWLSYVRYPYAAIMEYVVAHGPPVLCTTPTILSAFEQCKVNSTKEIFISGRDAYNHLIIERIPLWANWIVLIMLIIFFRVMAYLVLRYVKKPRLA